MELNKNQIITWQQAYEWAKLEEPKYITGFNHKRDKEFLKPFVSAKYIEYNHLKFCGVFRLTNKGKLKFEELKNKLDEQ